MWKASVNCEMLRTCRPVLAVNTRACLLFQRRVQDVISPIVFEAAYSLGEHVTGDEERELPPLTPVLRWKKGQKIAQKNQVRTLKLWTGARGGRCLWRKLWPWRTVARAHPLSAPLFPDLQNDRTHVSWGSF